MYSLAALDGAQMLGVAQRGDQHLPWLLTTSLDFGLWITLGKI